MFNSFSVFLISMCVFLLAHLVRSSFLTNTMRIIATEIDRLENYMMSIIHDLKNPLVGNLYMVEDLKAVSGGEQLDELENIS